MFPYAYFTQPSRLSLQDHRSLLQSLALFFVPGMLCASIGWQIIYWVLLSVSRFDALPIFMSVCDIIFMFVCL